MTELDFVHFFVCSVHLACASAVDRIEKKLSPI